MINSKRSQWIENKSREYLEITNFHKKDDPKGLNTLFVKISTLTCEKRQICPIFCVKSWNLKFKFDEKLKKKPMNFKFQSDEKWKKGRRSQPWIENKSREYLEIS